VLGSAGGSAGPALHAWLESAQRVFGDRPFTAGQALRKLGGTRRTQARRLHAAREAGWLLSSGRGPATTYRAAAEASPSPSKARASRR
jgi:hypothetical protein